MNQIIVQLNPDVPPTGSDLGVVNAARKSFGRRSEWCYLSCPDLDGMPPEIVEEYKKLKGKDKRLLEFLARGMTAGDFDKFCDEVSDHSNTDYPISDREALIELLWQWRNTPTHDTPFNHGFFSFEVKAPIFTARHLVKHEYLIMSEYSRRYITDDVEFYTPEIWRKASTDVKQGSSSEGFEGYFYYEFKEDGSEIPYEYQCGVDTPLEAVVKDSNERLLSFYTDMVDRGIAPEQARMVLPQSLMTSWTWSGTLGAFANMCKLRLAKDTQYETRLVAQGVYEELKKQFPVSAKLLVEGVL
jgi:thymidylate synthase (FAD)